jgi:hypothetical protein
LNPVMLTLKTPVDKNEHGIHDINEAFTTDDAGYIIHDSCGFQIGNTENIQAVKDFLVVRSRNPKLSERLHAIWYVPTEYNVCNLNIDCFLQVLYKSSQ